MPGMGSGLSNNDPLIVAAFHRALLHQGFVVLAIVAVVAIAWNLLRSAELRRAETRGDDEPTASEPVGRRVLRLGFGLLWVFDGFLQMQSSMPLGLPPDVIEPSAAGSPHWVQQLVQAGTSVWTYHPVGAASASVWIQLGIGVWMIAASRGNWSRLAGVAGAGWALVVWIFGEAFGGILAPGVTWLFGAPGAVLLYLVAGVLVACPDRVWSGPRLGRWVLGGIGAFFIGMAVLQAWPGRGFWHGQLTAMVSEMAKTPQPHVLSSWVGAFASFDAGHAWAVNLFCVVALAGVGACFLFPSRPRVVRAGLIAGLVLCLAVWVLIQDLGFMGGEGTDPNSMIPMALLLVAGYLALTRPAAAVATARSPRPWREQFSASPAYAFRCIAAIGALGITLVGAAPMAVAAGDRSADSIITEAVDGQPTPSAAPAPAFQLIDQRGQAVSLSGLRGKVVALTFLDPICTSDCPLIAQMFRQTDRQLGPAGANVVFVSINANPLYLTTDYLNAFDRVEHMDTLPNWLFLTGPVDQLRAVWRAYGLYDEVEQGGAMVDHSDVAFVIDSVGRIRYSFNTDPGPGTSATMSSFAQKLAGAIRSV